MSEQAIVKSKKKLWLSASRINTYLDCSALYYAKYTCKVPDTSNDGARRGSTSHDVLELLLKPKHFKRYSDALHHDCCKEVPALWRLICGYAKRHGVYDEKNLDMVDKFIMTALKNEFFGRKGVTEREAEKEFNLDVTHPDGRAFSARGFIDKLLFLKDLQNTDVISEVDCVDYKSSKKKFEGDKVTFNIQANIYQLALKYLYPHVKTRKFRFLFLAFPKNPWQEIDALTDEQLLGFEWWLTDLYQAMGSFNESNALSHPAKDNQENCWLCGRDGIKKDGTKMWVCSVRHPMDYFVLLDKGGEVIESAFTEEELLPKIKEGETSVEKRRWKGCPAFYDQKTGKRKNWS